jgi:hypothetical protein
MAPVFMCSFITFNETLQGNNFNSIVKGIKKDFWTLLITNYYIWVF